MKKSSCLSSAEILVFCSHCSPNTQPILDCCFIPSFKLKYEDSENVKAERANTVISFYIKSNRSFWDTHNVTET